MLFPSAQTLNINAWTFLSSFNFKVKFYHKNRTILSLISWKIRKFATLFRPKFFYHNESKEIINKEIYLTSEHLDPASGNFRSDALILSLSNFFISSNELSWCNFHFIAFLITIKKVNQQQQHQCQQQSAHKRYLELREAFPRMTFSVSSWKMNWSRQRYSMRKILF